MKFRGGYWHALNRNAELRRRTPQMRVSRSFPGKKNAIVYDIIYDHYMSFYQFYNKKGDCRMTSHFDYTKYYDSLPLFLKFLNYRFKGYGITPMELQEFNEKYYNGYVLNIR